MSGEASEAEESCTPKAFGSRPAALRSTPATPWLKLPVPRALDRPFTCRNASRLDPAASEHSQSAARGSSVNGRGERVGKMITVFFWSSRANESEVRQIISVGQLCGTMGRSLLLEAQLLSARPKKAPNHSPCRVETTALEASLPLHGRDRIRLTRNLRQSHAVGFRLCNIESTTHEARGCRLSDRSAACHAIKPIVIESDRAISQQEVQHY